MLLFWSHHNSHAENNVHNMRGQDVVTILAPPDFHGIERPCSLAQHQNTNTSHDAHGSIIRGKAESYGLAQLKTRGCGYPRITKCSTDTTI